MIHVIASLFIRDGKLSTWSYNRFANALYFRALHHQSGSSTRSYHLLSQFLLYKAGL